MVPKQVLFLEGIRAISSYITFLFLGFYLSFVSYFDSVLLVVVSLLPSLLTIR